jgi:hypothetical protein
MPSHNGTLLAKDRSRSRTDFPAVSQTAIDRRFQAHDLVESPQWMGAQINHSGAWLASSL